MSERDHYPAGVPCWVDTLHADPKAAIAFYGDLFGWRFAGPGLMPGDPPGEYWVAELRGRAVAGVGSRQGEGEPGPAGWNTYVSVASADEAAAKAVEAGGSLAAEPFDAPPAGRMAVIEDPAGAALALWEPQARRGAELLNEPSAWAMSFLLTPDPDGAKAFYGALFGWITESFDTGAGEATLWHLPGYVGGEPEQPVARDVVAVMLPSEDGEARWSVDFWVDDVDAAAARAADTGGRAVVPPYDIPGFRQAVLEDPEGATFTVSRLAVPG